MFSEIELTPDKLAIPIGCFADPGFPAHTHSLWCESKHGWVGFPESTVTLKRQPRRV